MKKKVILFGLLLFIFSFIYLSYKIYFKLKQNNLIELNIDTLPTFSFTSITSESFNNKDLINKKGTIIFNFFSPTCEHCQYMAKMYKQHENQLKNITILMVTIADSSAVANFNNMYQIYELKNIILLRDTDFLFYKLFGTSNVPSFFIYKNNRLIKKVIGETRIENLLN